MLRALKSLFPQDSSFRLGWHKFKAALASFIYRYPANKMVVIGITGTNGKTTTTKLTAKILEKAGYQVGMASTVSFQIGNHEWQNKTHKTSLGPFQMQRLLRKMVKAGCTHAVVETSSHALAQHRVYGVSYDVAALTNVTPEHLDYHKSMRAYRQEKQKLFEGLVSSKRKNDTQKISIHNTDDHDNFEEFMKFDADQKIGYGRKALQDERLKCHIRAENIQFMPDKTELTLITPDESKKVQLLLPGDFNVENLLCATAIGYSLGANLSHVQSACEDTQLIPGRMEAIDEGQDFQVFIDFAMTEDGYEKLLKALRPITPGNIWVVFGCCGDRDRKKRPIIGEICGEMADRVVVCDDEPYTEDPKTIRDMILEGLEHSKMTRDQEYFEIPDRAEAIRFACQHAKKGDTIVVPGMGDFEGRTFAEGIRPWCERDEVRKALKDLHQEAESQQTTLV